jgi:isoleucyl-tRNA synthetase
LILEERKQNKVTSHKGIPLQLFFEGLPSANGLPGIHHVMARAIKDIFCRYKHKKGFQESVKRVGIMHGYR